MFFRSVSTVSGSDGRTREVNWPDQLAIETDGKGNVISVNYDERLTGNGSQ